MGTVFSVTTSLIRNSIEVIIHAFNKNGFASGGWCFLKYTIFVLIAKIFQHNCQKNICNYSLNFAVKPEKLGIVTTKAEWDIENPLDFTTNSKYSQDKVFFYCGNSNGDCLIVHITKKNSNIGEASLFLKLIDKGCFELPLHPNINIFLNDLKNFSANGLEIKCLSPFRRWRISYNGLLRDINDPNGDEKHVKFSFVWMPVSVVSDLQTNFSPYLLAESVLKNDGQFFEKFVDNFRRILDQLNSYDQWGQSIGTVLIDNDPELELYLWGIRTRNKNTHTWNEINHGINFYGYLLNGFLFHFGVFSIPGTKLKSIPFGYIILPNRKILAIDWFDDSFIKKYEDEIIEEVFHLQFKCGKNTYKLSVDHSEKIFNTLHNENFTAKRCIRFVKYKLNHKIGYGIIEHVFKNDNKLFPQRKIQIPLKISANCKLKEIPMVVGIKDDISKLETVSGGKGSSLSHLSSFINNYKQEDNITFMVPDGIIVTTAAYQHHLRSNRNIFEVISEVENELSYENIEINNWLEENCNKIIREFYHTSLDNLILEEITKKLFNSKEDCSERKTYAVRSSAVGEDNAEFSSAGQMLTFLGLYDITEICDAVIKCWGSQFSYSAIQYKRKNGQPINGNMAVVIQEMVYSEISGVLFTCDPISCNPAYITITANYGLGETVVSALTEPDTIILKRSSDGCIIFHSKSLGTKKLEIVVTKKGKIEKEINKDKSQNYCLNENQALLLGKISIQIEEAFGGLQDIEWGIVENTVYLLQARPVTILRKESQFEIIHEFDTGLLTEYEYLTTANLGEVMPGAISPLSMSTVLWALDLPIKAITYIQEGKFLSSFNWSFYQTFSASQHHIFFNMLDFILMRNEKKKSFASCIWEVCLLGRLLKDGEEMKSKALERHGYFSNIEKFQGLINVALVAYKTYRKRNLMKEKYSEYKISYENYSKACDLYQILHECLIDLCEIANFHIMTSMLSSVYTTFILTFLEKDCSDDVETIFAKFSELLSHCDGVQSADVPSSLKELAKIISHHTDKDMFKKSSLEEAYQWIIDDDLIGKAYASFIHSHGYRCLKEYDLYSVRWEEKPLELIKCIQAMINNTEIESSKQKSLNIDEAVDKLGISLGFIKRNLLKILTSWGRHGVRTREESKALLVKTLRIFRKSYLQLGKLMTKEYRLPDSQLIFFLTHDEIGEIITEHSSILVYKSIQRKHLYNKLDKYIYPEITSGPVKQIDIMNMNYKLSEDIIYGTPGSKGNAEGIARVILNLDEASMIQPGDILITYSTDIGWTPYFPLLSGVVTELGGLISHGAVVAREYGLPCIVGAKGAVYVFKSGDRIFLDGTKGTLRKIEM